MATHESIDAKNAKNEADNEDLATNKQGINFPERKKVSEKVSKKMDQCKEIISNINNYKKKRLAALFELKSLIKGSAIKCSDFKAVLSSHIRCLCKSSLDQHSEIVVAANDIIGAVLENEKDSDLEQPREDVIQSCLEDLKSASGNKASFEFTALKFMVTNVYPDQLVGHLSIFMTSTHAIIRRVCYKLIEKMVREWPSHLYEKELQTVQEALLRGIKDTDKEIRDHTIRAFTSFQQHFKVEADATFSRLTKRQKNLINAQAGLNVTSRLKDQAKNEASIDKEEFLPDIVKGDFQITIGSFKKIAEGRKSKIFTGLMEEKKIALRLIDLKDDDENSKRACREIRTFNMIDRLDNFVSMIFEKTTKESVMIGMPYYEYTLEDFVRQNQLVDQRIVNNILLQLIRSIADLHELSITHGDLTPSHVFLVRSKGKNTVKVSAFRRSRIKGEDYVHKPTLCWTPPEFSSQNRYSRKSDIYNAGKIFYYTWTKGKLWLATANKKEYHKKIQLQNNSRAIQALDHMMCEMEQRQDANFISMLPIFWKDNAYPSFVEALYKLMKRSSSDAKNQALEWMNNVNESFLAEMNLKSEYRDTLSDLIRFLRNVSVHFREIQSLQKLVKDYQDLDHWIELKSKDFTSIIFDFCHKHRDAHFENDFLNGWLL